MTLVTVGGVSKYHPLILILRVVEAFGYRFSDHITSNLPCFYKHIKDKEKFTWLPNGVDVDEITNPEPIPDSFYPNKKRGEFIVGYAGALGQVNSISILLEAAKELKNITELFFYIVGDGKELDNLVQYANEHELCNVKFFPKVKKKQMPEILKEFDVCYLGWKNESLYEFGISPNKLPEYFFAKKPVLHSYSGAGDLVSNAQAGITIPAENLTELVNAIVSFKNMSPENLNLLGVNGYNFAVSNLSYAEISKSFSKLI
ncbi:glycosyltransferase [Shewanella marisflavi]